MLAHRGRIILVSLIFSQFLTAIKKKAVLYPSELPCKIAFVCRLTH